MKKRILSMMLVLCMVLGMMPVSAFAAETDNLCDHHTEHTADCGYAAAVEGSPCTHECGEECVEACTHVHDEVCGYVEAVAEVPCGYVCEESHEEELSEEPDPVCICETKCADGSVNSECAVCSVEGADLSGCVGEEAAADDEDGWFTVSGNTVTIDGTLGGKTTATEDDVNTLLEAIKGYVDNRITTIVVTGGNPAVIEVSGIVMPAVSEAIYRLSGSSNYDENNPYNGKIDLIIQDVTEIMKWEFYDAFALNSITLPNVMKLGDSAFFGCRYLKKITFGLVLTEIQNTSGATFDWVGEEVGGCDLVLNCGQMQGATDYQPNIGTATWCYTEFKSITLAHIGGEATCTVQAVCSVCGDSYGELADHTTENDVCTLCGAMEIVVSFDAGDYNWETGDQIKLLRQSTDDYGYPVHTNYYFTATVAEDGTVTWTPDKSLYSDGTGEHTLAVSYPNMDLLYQNFGIPGDQSTLEKLREADCMNAIWSGNPTTDPITLNLTHRLAKVTVDYEVPEGVAVSKAEIYTLTQYLLFDFNTLERRDITGEEGDDLWINSYHNGNQFTAFVSPDAYAADGNFIKITLSDGTVREVKMTKAVTFAEGVEYTYKVVITADGAYLTCADECSFAYTDNGDGTHDATCTVCGAVVEDEAHSGGTATCTEQAECQHCGESYGELNANNHNWENGVCTYECGTTHDPHTFENGICTVCGMAEGPVELAITQQPTDSSAKLGETYCVEVIAQGEGLTYQWYFRNAGTNAWHKSSVTDNTYDDVMTTARAGREVYCVITDASGNSVTTDTATLIAVKTAELAITQQPNDASAKLGEEFCVEVLAEGDGLKYQWYWRQIGSENWNVSGVRDNTYDDVMTSARHNREVYCVITDAWGDSVTTEIATITGIPTTTLEITRQPESQTVTLGDMFNVTFEAQGDGLKYLWYFRKAGTEVWYTSGQRDNSYDDVMTKARHNRELYCVVTDAWGNTLETNPIVVIMATPRHELAITAQPENESVKMDEMFCVTVEAQGDELRYQWYWRNVGSENWNVSGQRDNTYDDVMTKARHNREVYCVITDMWGKSVETNVVTITAIPGEVLGIVTDPTDASAAMGENYCVTVEAQGDGLTYQWYFKNAGSDVWHKSTVRDNTYDDVMTKARAGRQVYCVITDMWGNTVTTETVTLVCTDDNQTVAMN